MKITKRTGELVMGTIVSLPGGEILEIRGYDRQTNVYRVWYLEFDGTEFAPISGERTVNACDLIGAEI